MTSVGDLEGTLAVIRRAIHDEVAGQRFYSDAAHYCIDPWAKEIFARLAQDEEEHTRLLLAEYEALKTRGWWLDPETALAKNADVDITRFTFPDDDLGQELFPPQWSAADAIDRRADDLTALAFGVRMEQEAIDLYAGEAEAAHDPAARQAYQFLVEEETRHWEQLRGHWEALAGIPFQDA
jgi:rubrerythrin